MFVLYTANIHSQKSDDFKSNSKQPILFGELLLGYAGGSANGTSIGGLLNYQTKNNLFTFRYVNQANLKEENWAIFSLLFPFLRTKDQINEFSLLYGKRIIKDNKSYSFSAGLSYNILTFHKENLSETSSFIGLPFEVNIKWFKKEKKRFRAYYGLIPIGQPTSFGRSIGFKFYGNIGEFTYVGLGLTYGFGWHKKY